MIRIALLLVLPCALFVPVLPADTGAGKKVVFIAGDRSHGWGAHEFNAGCLLMQRHFLRQFPEARTEVHLSGWPADPESAFEGASSVVIFCDGGQGHLVNRRLDEFDEVMRKGVGLASLHYAVEVPIGPPAKHMLAWMGGYFEAHWSVNPHWKAEFTMIPDHPITRGVEPFESQDEWYYHMRFVEEMRGVTPVLSAHPPAETLRRDDGPHSGNPHVRKAVADGKIQHLGWAFERPGGGRGFGFTGLHFHRNFQDDNFRKLVLNAVAWTAGIEVPEGGVETATPDEEELDANQDFAKPEDRRRR